ncbi:MAG: hypothetical protein ABIS86_05475 [Streptosporangiaceae bacterium]
MTGSFLFLVGLVVAILSFPNTDLQDAYLAGLATLLAAVIVLTGAAIIDSNLTIAGRIDDFDAQFRAAEGRMAGRVEHLGEQEQRLLWEMQGIGDALNPDDELKRRRH